MKINFKKFNIRDLLSSSWFKGLNNPDKAGLKFYLSDKDFSKVSLSFLTKIFSGFGILFLLVILFICFEIYIPQNPISHETITYTVPKGWGDVEISKDLENIGIIRSSYFFRFYVVASFKHSDLKAGKYIFSPRMSIYDIAKKLTRGDVIKEKILIYEGWDVEDIGEYLESKKVCLKDDFIVAVSKDYSHEFDFLEDKPKDISLEGFLFPDTYEISEGISCDDFVITMLSNFEKKITPELKNQIQEQRKSVFDIITMASMLEKEVRTLDDKKIVSGILWKRMEAGMPLQIDATVNYVTGKSDAGVAIKDTKIDSPYNTYKYKGLPKGPISNPGMNSIIAAINPKDSPYWFYLSDGRTIFSKTFGEHTANKAKYLN